MKEPAGRESTEHPLGVEGLKQAARERCEAILAYCTAARGEESFFQVEKALMGLVRGFGVLCLQVFLAAYEDRLAYDRWLASGLYRFKSTSLYRTIHTLFGEVRYGRHYLEKSGAGSGFFPLDAQLGLTRDGFSPWVMSLCAKLATRVSFGTAALLFRCFYGGSPCSATIQELVLGMGREAGGYVEQAPAPSEEGEVLIIEVDGKATPTASQEELKQRRGPRQVKPSCPCGCQRHRGKIKRQSKKRKRRGKGRKDKNGRSITLVVMYTLKQGAEGKLHGPLNKKVWGSYAPRKKMLDWAREQATKRGFAPGTAQRIHIVVDGEKCLGNGLKERFAQASFALDIRHVEEKLWDMGRVLFKGEMDEVEAWVEERKSQLYGGQVEALIAELKTLRDSLSKRAKRDQHKREELASLIQYLEPRIDMMNYQQLIEQDLVIASGVVEGAARYVVGERMDCSGMRWIPGRAEALLHLRCIELNGQWEPFFEWAYERWRSKLKQAEKIRVQTDQPIDLPQAA